MNPLEFFFALLLLIAAGIALMLFGEAFRAHVFLFVGVWLFLPLLALCIRKWELFDVKSLRQMRIGFMIFVVAVSWIIFWGWDDVRNYIGNHCIDGYHHWTIETGENDDGETTYGQDWITSSAHGRWILNVLQIISVILAIGLPMITWKMFEKAMQEREKQEKQLVAENDQTNQNREN